MKKIKLSDFFRGWFVGDFEPTLFKSKDIEIAVQAYEKNHIEPEHFHKIATEITIMVKGNAYFNDQLVCEDEGIIIFPGEINIFKAATDCKTLVVKFPSASKDKYLIWTNLTL